MSVFDPDKFMDTTVTAPNSTKVESVPPGEYRAVIKEAQKPRVTNSKDGTKTYVFMDVIWSVDNDKLKAELGRDEIQIRQGISLDIDEEGNLDMGKGKNVALGKLREALGLNSGPFNPRQLTGAGPALISVTWQKGSTEYTQVDKVGKIS